MCGGERFSYFRWYSEEWLSASCFSCFFYFFCVILVCRGVWCKAVSFGGLCFSVSGPVVW